VVTEDHHVGRLASFAIFSFDSVPSGRGTSPRLIISGPREAGWWFWRAALAPGFFFFFTSPNAEGAHKETRGPPIFSPQTQFAGGSCRG